MNEPFLLRPAAKGYLWGGSRLNDEFAKGIDMAPLAETWECSVHPDGVSYVRSGAHAGRSLAEVLEAHPEYLGSGRKKGDGFPFLIKLIDAREDLSVQVHPTDAYAWERESGQRGKTEFWYVLDARRGAELVYGLSRAVGKDAIRDAVQNGTIEKYLQKVPVKKGDVFFIRAGVIHAIGAGTLIAEIQENSNLTYRLYDYGRADKSGGKRELHVDKALDVADLRAAPAPRQPMRVLSYRPGVARELLCRCEYFEARRMLVNTERRQTVTLQADAVGFRVLLCIGGCGTVRVSGTETLEIYKGDCLFVPADSVPLTLHGQMQFLDVKG